MNIQKLIDDYAQWLKNEISFSKIGEYYEITTPYLDNANDYLQIYVRQVGNDILFSDDSATINGLKATGFQFTPHRKEYFQRVLAQFGVECKGDELTAKAPIQEFARKKHLFIQAILRIDDMFALAEKKGETPFFFILDGIEDPHNLGAIIRTANLAGAHGVILPKRRAAGLTATVVKASAGAIHYTPVAKVTNIVSTIEQLKEKGMWFVCADMDGELMYRQNLTGPIGLVIGNEGKGVSRLVKEHCDFISSIPMKGDIDSLNASVAAGVLAYEIVRQRMNH